MASTNDNLTFAGRGRKRPQLNIRIERLFLDSENPRLPENWQGKEQTELVQLLYQQFNLDELAGSMEKNGYFDEEPLIATPLNLPDELRQLDEQSVFNSYIEFIENEATEFIVVEGNRRLASAKLLLDVNLQNEIKVARDFPQVTPEIANDLKILPVIIYPHRDEVIPYLGVRHIIGIRKWNPYAKARYLAKMIESGSSVAEVQGQIGDTQNAVLKSYVSYRLLEQAQDELDYNGTRATQDFSLLMVVLGQQRIKRFIGLPRRLTDVNFETPVPEDKLDNLKDVLTWVFGDGKKQAAISDSRQIPMLGHVLANAEATVYLKQTNNLFEAYDRTSGEEEMLLKKLSDASRNLEFSLGIAHRHKTFDVIEQTERCAKNANTLLEMVSKEDD